MLPIRMHLRTRILAVTGTVIVLLMFAISVVLLLTWRNRIITDQATNAVAISHTFAVTVIDAIFFDEQSSYRKENLLETSVQNFITRLGTVHYVAITDSSGTSIVHLAADALHEPGRPVTDDSAGRGSERVRLFEHPEFGWTLEVRQPLVFLGRQWGSAVIGFNARPIRDDIRSLFFILLISTIVITFVVLWILAILFHRMTASIEELARAIDSIDFSARALVDLAGREDEIGLFTQHFQLLQERLATSRRELEEAQRQIHQAEKLASIGRLAAGVAHQVNNPLNGIKSCIYAIRQDPANTERTADYLQLINEGIDNIEVVVRKLLGFARQQSTSEISIDIEVAIHRVLDLFALRLKEKNIEVVTRLAGDLPPVRIDTHLFQEVVMNLVLNSHDAIARDGVIRISTEREGPALVAMEISDNGHGIPAETMKHIFDPFFTTKDVGMGTGLGLSVCVGIIEAHSGRITVHSTPHVDTTFRITLPTDETETPDH